MKQRAAALVFALSQCVLSSYFSALNP